MNWYLGIGGVLAAAWLALWLALDTDAVHVLGILGAVFVVLGARRRARRLVGTAAADAGAARTDGGLPGSRTTPIVRLRPRARRHG